MRGATVAREAVPFKKLGFGYAACWYSLISPCSTLLRRTRTAPRSATGGSGSGPDTLAMLCLLSVRRRRCESSTAPDQSGGRVVRVTHPFHPLFGRRFEFEAGRRNWGEDRV